MFDTGGRVDLCFSEVKEGEADGVFGVGISVADDECDLDAMRKGGG